MSKRDDKIKLETNFPVPETLKARGYTEVTPTPTAQEQPKLVKSAPWRAGTLAMAQDYADVDAEEAVVTEHTDQPGPEPELEVAVSPRAVLLREAETLIVGDRNHTYGTPTQNFANIAALLNIQFGHKLKDGEQFTSADVAQIQIHTKMARLIAQPKRDSYVDIAGYAACGWEAQEAS